jgi:hypothetical protein
MNRALLISILAVLAVVLGGCGPAGNLIHFVGEPWAVEHELAKQTGLPSNVSLSWDNMKFSKAIVTFEVLPNNLTVSQVASAIREALNAKVHQQPEELVIVFKMRR